MTATPPSTEPVSRLASRLALTDADRDTLRALLSKLVRTRSFPGEEGDAADILVNFLRDSGIEDVHIDESGNVFARIGNGSGPTILYDGHMDTVLPSDSEWPYPPFNAEVVDGVMYGLGTCDMKAAVAAMAIAAKRLVDAGQELYGTLILAFVVQEEPCEGCGLKALVEEAGIKPDYVLIGEPSDLRIMRGQRGRVMFKLTVQGKSAHASFPEKGANAITAAARMVFGIELLSADLQDDPFLGAGTIAVTKIESQAPSLNAIPDKCSLYVDRRLTLGETPTRAQAELESVIEREGIQAQLEIVEHRAKSYTGKELHAREAFNAWALEENHDLLKTLKHAVKTVLGETPDIAHWPFSTDGVYSMGEVNIPTIGLGPGKPEHAHTIEEQVKLADVEKAAHIYALMAALTLSAAG